MTEEERLAIAERHGIVTCELHPLSTFNACLVATQDPTATVVGGLRQWQRNGRRVRKGQHGVCIWVPKKEANQVDQAGANNEEPNEQRFILVTVFDIRQTEASEEREHDVCHEQWREVLAHPPTVRLQSPLRVYTTLTQGENDQESWTLDTLRYNEANRVSLSTVPGAREGRIRTILLHRSTTW